MRRISVLSLLLLVVLAWGALANSATFATESADKPFNGDQYFPGEFILITGGKVVNHDLTEEADVLIANGKIASIGKNIDLPVGGKIKVIDAKGKYVMPGGIDPHVHMELPFMGTVSADDFYYGSAAALAGGTTMIIDFAIPAKGQSLLSVYDEYRQKASKAPGDYAFHMGVVDWTDKTAEEMEILVKEKGINSFKVFMAYKNAFMLDDAGIYQAFRVAKRLGCIPMVHAENGELVESERHRVFHELNITGPEGHPLSRPSFVEAEATNRAITIARTINVPLYVVHVMSAEAMEAVKRAKLRGQRVIGEPVVSGLVLDDSYYRIQDWDVASRYVMSPPLRPSGENERLVGALASGILDLVATDHCVFNTTQKRMGRNDFRLIPNGLNGVEDRMNIVWDLMVSTGRISPNDYVRITSTKAAQIFNIYPRKGAIRVGSDADVIVLNPDATKTISAETHHHNIDYNVYEGKTVRGVVEVTISNGKVVWENGKLNVERGAGNFVPTPPFGIMYDGLEKNDALNAQHAVERSE